jgi:predicted KAP-like P-loop ATPase
LTLTILTDELAKDLTKDFQRHSELLMEMIAKSNPPDFSIGLYGEWGTGKTTLMKFIYDHWNYEDGKKKSIIPVWFNAWMYERENQFALYPLLLTMAKSIPEDKEKKALRNVLQKFAIGIGKGFLKSTPEIALSLLPSIANKTIQDTTKNITSEISNEFLSLFGKTTKKVISNTLYSNEIENIKKELERIKENDPNFRIVIFVDDLDRCSPLTTLEVFESIKVFLGIEGFIYILGISNETIIKFLNYQFQNLINGEHYLRKIIQVPITLPEWTDTIISDELIDKYVAKLKDPYKTIILNKKKFIIKFVEFNPREVKRFINSFIIAKELFPNDIDLDDDKTINEIFAIQALKTRWLDFFSIFSINNSFRNLVNNEYISKINKEEEIMDTITEIIDKRKKAAELEDKEMEENYRKNGLYPTKYEKRLTMNEKHLFQFGEITHLWKFLFINKDIIFSIQKWNLYNKLAKITIEKKNIQKDFGSSFRMDQQI